MNQEYEQGPNAEAVFNNDFYCIYIFRLWVIINGLSHRKSHTGT